MKTGKLALIGILAIASSLLASCRHKDLYMDEALSSDLQVVFDWSKAPEGNPSSMVLYLFDENGMNPMRFIFDNRFGGGIKAPFGTRHAICLNADNTDWARMRNKENIETLEIYTSDAESLTGQRLRSSSIPRAEGTESERLANTPGMLWGDRVNDIAIKPHQGTQTITMYPGEAICHYTVDVLDVSNIGDVSSSTIDTTLSGMAEGYNHGAEAATEVPVTMTFNLTSNTRNDALHGEFLTFGECPTNKVKHMMTLYMVLSDGSKWWHTFDVTDQVTQAPDPKHVHIVVRGLHLPDHPTGGGSSSSTSMTADVNEWQSVNVDLKM